MKKLILAYALVTISTTIPLAQNGYVPLPSCCSSQPQTPICVTVPSMFLQRCVSPRVT